MPPPRQRPDVAADLGATSTRLAAAASEPADWPALWQALLQARYDAGAATRAGRTYGPAEHACPPGESVSDAATALGRLYRPLIDAPGASSSRPWVLGQLGQSLDGCIATARGDSHYVTGAHSLLHLHRLRALCDAVLVGPGTVAADDPQLTTRHVPGPNPVRVVLDPALRLDGRARVLCDGQAPTWWLCDPRHAARARALSTSRAEVVPVPGLIVDAPSPQPFDPAAVLATLGERGVRVLLVEGGGQTVSHFLACAALDRLHLVIAPVLIGDGRRGLQGPARLAMADCPRPRAQVLPLGADVLWDLDLRAV